MTAGDLRISGHVPAGWLARRLWAAGVYSRELLESVEHHATVAEAWEACERLELVLPLAVLRGARMGRIASVAATWWEAAESRLGDLGWCDEDAATAQACVFWARAPDIDVAGAETMRDRALERAGKRAPGRHRYRMMTAAAHLASLGVQRVRRPLSAAADGELVAEHLLGAVHDAAGAAAGDLFAEAPDAEGFARDALATAYAALGAQ